MLSSSWLEELRQTELRWHAPKELATPRLPVDELFWCSNLCLHDGKDSPPPRHSYKRYSRALLLSPRTQPNRSLSRVQVAE